MALSRVIRICILLLVAGVAWPAAPAITLSFDHQTTGFELDGAHRDLPCESCHINAIFKGTPRSCDACHSRGTRYNALPKPANHVLTSDRCDACHSTTAYQPVVHFDHAEVRGSCASCHNNVQAQGKPGLHISTTADCATCHSTAGWLPAAFDHGGIADNCVGCHNGTRAGGKNATHLATGNSCESCHSVNAWQPWTRFDHAQANGSCESCHSGLVATSVRPINGKSANHFVTAVACSTCHMTIAWVPANFAHTGITSSCVSCHNGSQATGKNDTHIASTSDCESCHSVVTWKPGIRVDHAQVSGSCVSCHGNSLVISTGRVASKTPTHITSDNNCQSCHTALAWKPANFKHNGVTGNCVSCHNGVQAAGKTATHMASGTRCESCHSVVAWKPGIRVDHSQVSGSCLSCHSNTLAISTGTVAGKTPNHIASDNNCQNCHTTLVWKPANFQHNGITGNCASCHNGAQTTGKNPAHIASSNSCESCHSVIVWKPAPRVDHAQVGGTCLSCHNNTLAISTGTVAGKTPTHITSDNSCQNCHSTLSWVPANFQHNGISGNCATCHNGTQAAGKDAAHITSTSSCEGCHSVAVWKPSIKVDHAQVSGSCLSCHNNSLVISSGIVAGKSPTHIASDNNCQGCHTTLAWKPATFNHSGITGNCFSCHNGTQATGKTPTHITSDNNCQSCHTTVAWKPANFQHNGITGNCFSCHNGTQASGKNPTHFASTNSCESCHSVAVWKPSVKVDHAQASGSCVSCHGNTLVISTGTVAGKTPTHIVADNNCQSCHTTLAWKPANFQHNGVTGNCFSCHNGIQAGGKNALHPATSNSCESCHSVTVWKPSANFDHAQVNGTCLSCHNNTLAISTGTVAGKTATHIAADNNCQNCHTTLAWTPANFKHNGITGNCISCHNGTLATGKTLTHIASTNSCESCHSVAAWKPASTVDHTQVSGTCLSCHNNTLVISTGTVAGKIPTHIPADNSCQNCHTTLAWKPANFQHNGITGNCVSCHNGTQAAGKTLTHIVSTNSCESCHSVAAWQPGLTVDHTQVSGTCLSCHNNTLLISTGTVAGKPPTHIPADSNCQTCHTTTAWRPASFSHAGITSNCFSCHNGIMATGKSAVHLTTSNSCESCHVTLEWLPAQQVDHVQVTGTCVSCHSGTKSISTGLISGMSATHMPTSTSCTSCHKTTAWKPAVADHTQIPLAKSGKCNSCHNGAIASGMPINHVVTTKECGACHTTLAWKPATFSHTGITTGCGACHDGLHASGKQDASKPHFVTTRECNLCHTTTAWTPITRYVHQSVNYSGDHKVSITCTNSGCHGTNAESVTWRSPAYINTCAGCHQSKYKTDPHNKYGNTRYTVGELANCSGACHVYTDATLKTIKTRRNGPQHRVTHTSWSN